MVLHHCKISFILLTEMKANSWLYVPLFEPTTTGYLFSYVFKSIL